MKEVISKGPILHVSERAVNRIKELLLQDDMACGVRVGVQRGGCSGFSYSVDYAYSKSDFDEVVLAGDVSVFIDKKAIFFLLGAVMDYVQHKFSSSFIFMNPKEKIKCGCGRSFSV
ncbi:HesB/IscA family protein [Candidatus Sneabacter namystus]|uniref:Iron-sulfur cluster assembly accessory protein n=1 Tax=Candidatus Sneabacter namystus TaxID=2601646 RepID=A0A5C0UHQ8_9RICK|nr:iron-sulfur cluster assembly accessory protein [Candidatus Sneabacter namystus]QEK39566.1 iron-sulfur cluster assembly accessory protein [Candidatus Sneabacter namystus]